MSQVTIYLPKDVERLVRREAKRARKSLSSWIADLAREAVKPSEWPVGYFEFLATPPESPMRVPEDLPIDEPESM
jgi:hypothetical protein